MFDCYRYRCKQEGLSLDHVFRLDQFHRLPWTSQLFKYIRVEKKPLTTYSHIPWRISCSDTLVVLQVPRVQEAKVQKYHSYVHKNMLVQLQYSCTGINFTSGVISLQSLNKLNVNLGDIVDNVNYSACCYWKSIFCLGLFTYKRKGTPKSSSCKWRHSSHSSIKLP